MRGIPSEAAPRDEGVALVAVLIMLVLVVPLALGALGIVVKRQKDVVYERGRTFTAHAAEAGLDAATLAIRAAESDGLGQRDDLPCTAGTAISGTVSAQEPGLRYSVTIRYYLLDPRAQPEAWRQANELTCTPGQGPSAMPHFALLNSTVTGSQTGGSYAALRERSLESVYRFRLDDANIGGGLVRPRNPGGAGDLCWSADVPDGATPQAGAGAIVATCQYGSAAQMLSYRPDHSISSVTAKLCLTTQGVHGSPVTFETCTGASNQVWIYNTSDHIQAVDLTGTSVVDSCIAMAQANVPGTPLVLSADCGSTQTQWSPEARTGPGGAGDAQHQLVNFAQFARCLDVAAEDWNHDFLQLHPCTQSPTGLDWPAQQLMYDATTGQLRFGNPRDVTNYCLRSPPPGGDHTYVTTNPCSGSPFQRWTRTGDTGVWATSYTIVDDHGRCLAQGPVPDEPGSTFNSVIVAPCDGSAAEKWNAPPEPVHAGLEGFYETTGQ